MRTVGKVLGVLMMLGGVVWILQGVNVLPGSFMTGDPRWAVRGLVLVGLGILIFFASSRRRSGRGSPSSPE